MVTINSYKADTRGGRYAGAGGGGGTFIAINGNTPLIVAGGGGGSGGLNNYSPGSSGNTEVTGEGTDGECVPVIGNTCRQWCHTNSTVCV